MPARRFLAPQARAGNGHGYLTQPPRPLPPVADPPEVVERIAAATNIEHEPEAPSDHWLNPVADRAYMLNLQARLAEIAQAQTMRPALTLEQRMLDANRRAKLQKIDITFEFTAVKRMLDHAKTENDKRRRHTEQAAARRLERIEVRLDQMPDDLAA